MDLPLVRLHKTREVVEKFIHKYSRLPTENDPEYLEMLRMSKYQIYDEPRFKPGRCGNCGSSKNDGRRYVDFGLEIEFYGTLFLCSTCVEDVARNMGIFDSRDKELEALHFELQSFKDLKQEGAALHELVAGLSERLNTYYDGIQSAGNYTTSDSNLSVVTNEAATEESVERSSSESSGSKSRAAKSTTSSGRSNLRSITELRNDSTE